VGVLDITYLRKLRDVLVEEGHTGVHHLLTGSGWTTHHIESADDFDHAPWLLRVSYLHTVGVVKKTPPSAAELAGIDVDAEVVGLGLSEAARAAFERRAV
jgi:hypothetical protein